MLKFPQRHPGTDRGLVHWICLPAGGYRVCTVMASIALLVVPLYANVPGQKLVLAPPTRDDIIRSLGPDAQGLQIQPDSLPDIFALTAGRIDEDPKKFIVEQPYVAGRWVGGKASIEFARDLSYTIVSVYDKKGKRQRIYSVTRRPLSKKVAAALAQTVDTPSPLPTDEAIPLSSDAAIEEVYEEVAVEVPPPSSSPASAKRKSESKKAVASLPKEAGVDDFEWDDNVGAYVPKGKGSWAKTTSTSNVSESYETPRTSKGSSKSASKSVPVVAKNATPPPSPRSVPVATPSPSVAAVASAHVVDTDVPSTEELLGIEGGESGSASSKLKSGPVQVAKNVSHSQMPAAAASSSYVWSDEEGAYVPKSKSSSGSKVGKEPALEKASVPPVYEEPSSRQRKKVSQEVESVRASEVVAVAQVPSAVSQAELAGPDTSGADGWSPQASKRARSVEPEELPVKESRKKGSAKEVAPPSVEALMETAGPDTAGADAWTPKETPKRKAEPEEDLALKAAMKVASVPKPTTPSPAVNPSIDDLLKVAAESKKAVPSESESWVPKTSTSKRNKADDADVAAEIERVKKMEARKEKAAAASPVIAVRQDVNNPEEGVLPIHSFEKFSGARYGRHREYERRVYWGKRPKAPVENYDFYVDEVDRKKEFQTIYYYQKGKVPKLVAQEKYSSVKFLSNYDVDSAKNGSPKVTKY